MVPSGRPHCCVGPHCEGRHDSDEEEVQGAAGSLWQEGLHQHLHRQSLGECLSVMDDEELQKVARRYWQDRFHQHMDRQRHVLQVQKDCTNV